MPKSHFLVFLFLLTIFTLSCKKEETVTAPVCPEGYDTLIIDMENELSESSKYLAAYPGSWWKLSNGDSLYCSTDNFIITEFASFNDAECLINYNRINWKGARIFGSGTNVFTKGFIDGDDLVSKGSGGGLDRDKIMNTWFIEHLTEDWWVENSTYGTDGSDEWRSSLNKRFIQFYDSYTLPNGDIYDNVAKIERKVEFDGGPSGGSHVFSDTMYYAMDIGLIRFHHPDNIFIGDLPDDVYVIDYFIAPH